MKENGQTGGAALPKEVEVKRIVNVEIGAQFPDPLAARRPVLREHPGKVRIRGVPPVSGVKVAKGDYAVRMAPVNCQDIVGCKREKGTLGVHPPRQKHRLFDPKFVQTAQ